MVHRNIETQIAAVTGKEAKSTIVTHGMIRVNSAIHKAAGRCSASSWNDPQGSFQPPAPFTAYGSFRNCTRQNHGTVGNREAGGFVNSAVK